MMLFIQAHCDFFITNDVRCKYKAEKIFERMKVIAVVSTSHDFVQKIHSPDQ